MPAERIPFDVPPGAPLQLGELREMPIFEGLSDDDLTWLVSKMTAYDLAMGATIIREGDPAEHMLIVLKGSYKVELKDGTNIIGRAPQVAGMLPFSRLVTYTGFAYTLEPARVATLHKNLFHEVNQRLPSLQSRLVHLLNDRVRNTTANNQQREKMMALGKLSAGLAHELNNPAAAAARAADNLRKAIATTRGAVLELDRSSLPRESRVFLAQLECDWEKRAGPAAVLDTLDRSDLEEQFIEWLQARNIPHPYNLAGPLVDLGCTIDILNSVAAHVPAEHLGNVLIRLTAAFTITRLADEISSSTGRISELVQAVKEYSYRDQTPLQEVDVHAGIENTLIMLRHKLKSGIEITREYDRSLPAVYARGSDLNQVWTNLISNAAEAMDGKGKLVIKTCSDGHCARVEIIDDGPGIAPDHQSHIFEPFFTTKGVGEGTGLGLDTSYRIVTGQGGDISFETRPGRTAFIVRLPFTGIPQTPKNI